MEMVNLVTEGVTAVHDTWSSHEVWAFECLSCGMDWDEQIDVRHYGDGHGIEFEIYERSGQPCTTPWAADRACPRCQSQNVKALSARRPKVVDVPEVQPNADVAMLYHLRRIHAW